MTIKYNRVKVEDQTVFYRECGQPDKPTLLLLHGFPTSSHMFRNLMPLLADKFHMIAPDFIGFGQSSSPNHKEFNYTFERLTHYVSSLLNLLTINHFYMYVFDYGAPIGFRLALAQPQSILGIVSQNGNIYKSGLGEKWWQRQKYWENPTSKLRHFYQSAFSPETIKHQYLSGEANQAVSPDGYSLDIYYTGSPDYSERQSDLIFDYQKNIQLYPQFQQYLRHYKPRLLAIWGKNDTSFIADGAEAFKHDDPNANVQLLDAGHFALETHCSEIAHAIRAYF